MSQVTGGYGGGVKSRCCSGNLTLGSIFVRPLATLDLLRDRPRWLAPLLLSSAYVTAANYYAVTRFGLERVAAAVVRIQSGVDPRILTESILAHKDRILLMHAASAFAGSILAALFAALYLWLLVLVAGGEVPFKPVLSVVVHVGLLVAVVEYTMVVAVVTLDGSPNTLSLKNLLATNPAFFLRPESRAVFRLLSSLDIISFARLTLLAAGLSKVSASVSRFAAFMVVFVPWCMYVAAGAVIPWLP
jgi:hypothetical protein